MFRGSISAYQPFVLVVLLLSATISDAQRDDLYIPDELEPWRDWVLQDREYLGCPFLYNERPAGREAHICAWPGELALDVTASGGRFTQTWTVYGNDYWIPLPGNVDHWPERIAANGEPASVVLRGKTPSVRLAPGRYTIGGRLVWSERPREIAIPPESGLLALTIDGERVERPEFGATGVWLSEREAAARMEDAIDVQVYRLIEDDVPTRLVTMFELDVSGSVREEVLRPSLPPGFVPLALDSALPARLEADGALRVQARPGSYRVRVLARGPDVMDAVALPTPIENLPDAEVWSYRSNDHLRVTVPEGLPPIDPERASVPDPWQELPAFRITAGESLAIVEQSRGRAARENQLSLDRRLWLDFDGGGYVFSDTVRGTMRSGWRLDMAQPFVLLSAAENDQELLVTHGPGEGLTGVELRLSDVSLQALGRSDTRGTMPASGWQARFDSMDAQLNVPPGSKLLAAVGVDSAPGAWVERWQLLDFFLVLIITIATARLFGRRVAAIAFFALVLSWHAGGAPQWVWLNLLVAVVLARVAPAGRLRKLAAVYRGLVVAALVVIVLPFVAQELRIAIYPQLEPQGLPTVGFATRADGQAPPAKVSADDMRQREMATPSIAPLEEIVVTGSGGRRDYARYAPNAIVQAGPGRPAWRWNTYPLHWSGPVDAERTMTLTIMPRWLVSVLRFLEVLLLIGFAAVFVLEIVNRGVRWLGTDGETLAGRTAAWLVTPLLAGALSASPVAEAQVPSPEILEQFEQRLLEPPPCAPRCAEIVAADVQVQEDALAIVLDVHALDDVALPLPGSRDGWRPQSVQVDGTAARHVYRRADQTLWVQAAAGRHRITLEGPLPPVDGLDLPFPAVPRVITARADGWLIAGIRDRRLLSRSLQLTRLRDETAADAPARWDSSRFPVFVRIERTIELDLDWRVRTRVIRVAPEESAFTVEVPLLAEESVLTADLPVRNGKISVSMEQGQGTLAWESSLPRSPSLSLTAAEDTPWKEVWRFAVGSIWHADFGGVPESDGETANGAVRIAEFYPRAGETLTLNAERPAATSGAALAFDRVNLQTDIGARSRSTSLTLDYRSTRGSQHVIRLPQTAEVQSVAIDGRNEPLRANNGILSVPILPGEHGIELRWREDVEVGMREVTPEVDLGAASGNISLGLDLPANRWVLGTRGPALGPAVLYWSELAVLVLFAFILGRIHLTPLRTHHWLLLGIGFSTFSWPVLLLVTTWLLAAGARRRWPLPDGLTWWRFNAVQLLFAALTLAALGALVVAVPSGLLGAPDMHIAGNSSYGNMLRWFADQSAGLPPRAAVYSLPVWMYKVLILAWALWLSFALLRWLPWVWQGFTSQGLWRPRRRKLDNGGADTT